MLDIPNMDSGKLPLVSIVIPVHNSASWIRETLDNVLSQSYPCCEIIIVDDGSTDDTKQLIDAYYDVRVKYVYQENAGPARARNYGIKKAKGEYIQFLDSDDFLNPEKIARQMEVFSESPECDVVYCDFAFTTAGTNVGIENSPIANKDKYGTEKVFEALLDGNFIVIHSPLTRTEVIRSCGAFDESLSSDEDYDLWLKIAAKGHRFCFVPEVLAFYRKRSNSVSTNLLKQSNGTLQALNKARNYCATLTDQEKENLRRNLSREYGWTSGHYLSRGDYTRTLSTLCQSIWHNPRHGLTVAMNLMKRVINEVLNKHLLWRFRNK